MINPIEKTQDKLISVPINDTPITDRCLDVHVAMLYHILN